MSEKEDTFVCVWRDNELIDIVLPEPTTKSPTFLDKELVRIFQEWKDLKDIVMDIEAAIGDQANGSGISDADLLSQIYETLERTT